MGGTIEGGKAAAATNKEKYGVDFYREIGAKGGKAGTGHVFCYGKRTPQEVGRIGGLAKKTKRKQVAA